MDARTGADTFTTRTGALALPLSIIVFVVSTAIHPSREAPMDNTAVFVEYAQSDGWIAIHFAQWLGVLLLFGGFLALYYSLTTKQEAAAGVARFGFGAAVLTAASLTMLQAIDGVTLKWAVDAWVTAPADLKTAAFTAAEVARWTEYATQSYSNILLGLTLVLYGLAIALGSVYPRWLGWIAVGSGVAWIIHGLMVPYIGLFNSIPRLVALVLMAVWVFIIGYLMWRDGSRGRIRRTQSATPQPPHANGPSVSRARFVKRPVPSLESVMNSAERPYRNANLSVRSVLPQSPVFRIRKPSLSKFITAYELLFTEVPGRGILRSSDALS